MLPAAITTRLPEFPLDLVARTSRDLSKRFHAKVFTLFASVQSVASVYDGTPRVAFAFTIQRGEQAIECTYDSESLTVVRNWLLDDARAGGQQTRSLMEAWSVDWERFLTETTAFCTADLAPLNEHEFLARATALYGAYLKAGSAAYLLDALVVAGGADPVETLVSDELTAINVSLSDQSTLIPALIRPDEPPYATVAKQERLALAAQLEVVDHNRTLRDLPAPLQAAMATYASRWEWLENNYFHARRLRAADVLVELLAELDEFRRTGSSAAEEVQLETEASAVRQRDRDRADETIADHPTVVALVDTIRRWAHWKDVRKSGVQIGMGCFDLLLTEAGRRLDRTADELSHLVFPELILAVSTGRIPDERIAARREQVCYVATDHGYFITEGSAAEPYLAARAVQAVTDELIGKSASPGVVRGRVRVVVRTNEMNQFEDGEILVTNQTTPEFVPIMKKAAAIVTEQGGITSHAAVISRELGIPCVIGTTIATQVFKDGDLVEVDATNGTVRKIHA